MESLTATALRHPGLILWLHLILVLVAGRGALDLEAETGYRAALGAHHPSVERLDRFIVDFGAGLPVQVAWGCEAGSACPDALPTGRVAAAERIAASIRGAPGVRSVRTPGSTPLLDGTRGAIDSIDLASVQHDPEARVRFLARARADPFWRGMLIAEDARAAAVVAELESSDPRRHEATLTRLRSAVEAEPFAYALVGDPVDFALGGAALNRESRRLGVVALVLVASIVWLLFRTPLAIVPVLAAVGVAAVACLGLMGWMGWPENEISQAIVPLLLVIGVCSSIHLLSRYRDLPDTRPRLRTQSRHERLVAAAGDVGWPCFVAAVTTAVGLGSFVTSDLAGFVRFGASSFAGAFIALGTTFTLLPVLIVALRIDLPALPESRGWTHALRWLTFATRRHARAIVAGALALLVVGGLGIARLDVDVTKESLLGSESEIVKWQRWVAAHLRKPDSLELRLVPPATASLAELEVLGTLEAVAAHVESIPELGRTRSILDGITRMNQLLHGGDPAHAQLGRSRQENAQLLLLLESSDRQLLTRWVSPERDTLRLSSEAELLSKGERGELLAGVRAYLDAELPAGWSYELTGPLPVFADMVTELHETQLHSFIAATLAVALTIALCLRSGLAVLWAMGPSLLPIVLTLGAMGWMGTPLDTGTAMVGAIVLGIAVDDSVHLITRYRRHRKNGMEPSAAMTWSLEEVGRALTASSLTLSAGFLVMLLSSWGGIAAFGLLSASAIQCALLADLLLLPAFVYSFDASREEAALDAREERAGGRDRWRGTVVVLLAVVYGGLQLQVGIEVVESPSPLESDCAPLENGIVPLAAVFSGCAGPPYARDPGLPAEAAPSSSERVSGLAPLHLYAIQLGISALVLGLCLQSAWRSRQEEALPVALCGGVLAVLALSTSSSGFSPTAGRAGAVALCLLPGVLAHVGVVVPRRRSALVVDAPFLRMLYGALALVVAVGITTYFRFPELYAFVAPLLILAAGAAGLHLLVRAEREARGGGSAIESVRSRSLVVGAGAILALSVGCHALADPDDAARVGSVRALAAVVLLLAILPLVLAVRQDGAFRVHDAGLAVFRRWFRGALFVALMLALAALVGDGEWHAWRLAAGALCAWAAVELLDALVLRHFVGAGEELSQGDPMAFDATAVGGGHLTTESEVARQLVARLQAALSPRFVAVFFSRSMGWYPAGASESAPTSVEVGASAAALVEDGKLRHLPECGRGDAPAHELAALGVETLVPLHGDRGRRGVIVLGSLPRVLSTRDRSFLSRSGRMAASALSWADAAEQLGAARALARRGFLSASLTHDLGKPLTTIWAAARSLRRVRGGDALVDERLREIQEVADQGLHIIDQLFEKVQEEPGGRAPAGELVALACRAAQVRHGRAIQVHYGSEIHALSLPSEVTEALGELLSNACRESPEGVPVEVWIERASSGAVWIDVVDRGAGMSEATAAKAFEPWFTKRRHEGGRGLGLAISRLLVRQIGGDVVIVDRGGRAGTRFRISVESASASRGQP